MVLVYFLEKSLPYTDIYILVQPLSCTLSAGRSYASARFENLHTLPTFFPIGFFHLSAFGVGNYFVVHISPTNVIQSCSPTEAVLSKMVPFFFFRRYILLSRIQVQF